MVRFSKVVLIIIIIMLNEDKLLCYAFLKKKSELN